MPLSINNPALSAALAQALGIKGYASLGGVDDMVAAVVEVVRLAGSPFDVFAVPCMKVATSAAGGAGVYSGVSVRPGPGSVLEVLRIEAMNTDVAAHDFVFSLGRSSDYSATTSSVNLLLLGKMQRPGGGAQPATALLKANTKANATHWGTPFHQFTLAAGTRESVPLDERIFLWGTDPVGALELCIRNNDANVPCRAAFHCREWRLVQVGASLTSPFKAIHPALRAWADYSLAVGRAEFPITVTSVVRSFQEQSVLYNRRQACLRQGRVDLLCSYPAAAPGCSLHQYGLAFDSVPDNPAKMDRWKQIRRALGWEVFDSDEPHAEWPVNRRPCA